MSKFCLLLIYLSTIFFSSNILQCDEFKLYCNQLQESILIIPDAAAFKENLIEESIDTFSLKTKSDINVPIIFYNRKSDTLLLAAPALPAPKESMEIFAKIFPHYDIVTFDYRWSGHYETFLLQSIITGKPIERILLNEIEELQTVLDFIVQRKSYTTVIGLGECYSCFHFVTLQADSIKNTGHGPFTHLILDSCWLSLRHFAERICYDPFLPVSPKVGGAPVLLKYITNNSVFKSIVLGLIFSFMTNISLEPLIAELKIPILFIHGSKDIFVPFNHFEKIWQSTDQKNRALFLTPFHHADNLKNKKLYNYISDLFISSKTIDEFKNKCQKIYIPKRAFNKFLKITNIRSQFSISCYTL